MRIQRGWADMLVCSTPYCHGIQGRCLLCGGYWAHCQCHANDFAGCICGAELERWRELRPKHIGSLIWSLGREAVYTLLSGDIWWWTHGIRGGH